MSNVTQFTSGRMTEAQYKNERTELRETYGGNKREAGVRYEQELASLFARSGWTQKELAKKEGKGQSYICSQLLFGRFLNFIAAAINAEKWPNNLTEWRFRSYWDRTKTEGHSYNERQRFVEVQRLMAENTALREKERPSIVKPLIEQFGDGKWHAVELMAKKFDTTVDHVMSTFENMNKLSKCASSERKGVGKSFHYRIFKKTRTVSTNELTTKLKPIVEGLQVEGKKNIVTMSPPAVAHLAHQLAKLLDEWTE